MADLCLLLGSWVPSILSGACKESVSRWVSWTLLMGERRAHHQALLNKYLLLVVHGPGLWQVGEQQVQDADLGKGHSGWV